MASLMPPLWGNIFVSIANFLLICLSIFLILIVLIQRGKGGGLAGAFGGAGGSSAFGSRVGDAFTNFTIWTAAIWLFLVMFIINQTIVTTPLESSRVTRNQPQE